MIRVRWLKTTRLIPRSLAARMRRHLFTDELSQGFLVDRVREDYLEARFIEKLSFKKTMKDPFGNDLAIDRTEYRQVPFTLYRDELELRNPTRATSAFFTALQLITDFNVAITPLQTPVLQWIDQLQEKVNKTVVVERVQVSHVPVATDIFATILLQGGADVRDSLTTMAGQHPVVVDKARVRWTSASRSVVMHLERTGVASCAARDAEHLAVVRAAIHSAVR